MADVIPIKDHRQYQRRAKLSAAIVLRECRAKGASEMLVIGVDRDGQLFVNGSPPDPGNALWLMEMAKKKLLGP